MFDYCNWINNYESSISLISSSLLYPILSVNISDWTCPKYESYDDNLNGIIEFSSVKFLYNQITNNFNIDTEYRFSISIFRMVLMDHQLHNNN